MRDDEQWSSARVGGCIESLTEKLRELRRCELREAELRSGIAWCRRALAEWGGMEDSDVDALVDNILRDDAAKEEE